MTLEKKVGNSGPCGFCGKEIVCREKPASGSYAAIPQWQNGDGTPHYNVKSGARYVCPGSLEPKEGEIPPVAQFVPPTTFVDEKIPQAGMNPSIDAAYKTVSEAFAAADQLARQIYPTLQKTNPRDFSMIRSNLKDNILFVIVNKKG